MWSVLHQRIHVHKTVTGAHVADRRRWQPDQRHHSRKLERAQFSTCGRSRCFVSSVRCLNCMSQANFGTSPTPRDDLALAKSSYHRQRHWQRIHSRIFANSLRKWQLFGCCKREGKKRARPQLCAFRQNC